LKLAKDQAISSILLGLESSSARVSALARQEIIHGRRISTEETIEKSKLPRRTIFSASPANFSRAIPWPWARSETSTASASIARG